MTGSPQRKLAVACAGGFGRETVEAVRALNATGADWQIVGYLDEDPARHGAVIDGVPVLGGMEKAAMMPDVSFVVCTARPGDGTSRARIARGLGLAPGRYATVIHPSASVATTSDIGPGTVVLAQTVLTAAVRVGSHVAIMPHVTLTHDDVIGDFVTIASGACLGGDVRVGQGAYIGAGALVREHCSIGAGALVGMGAVVTRDVPPHEVWAGIPARRLRGTAALGAVSGPLLGHAHPAGGHQPLPAGE
jgi:sugar O-acyltransferase (sialic acid O-acetyltransferase NeuD family)